MEYKPDKIEKERPNMAFHPGVWAYGIGWWVCVSMFGFFKTVLWTAIITSIIVIILKLKENTRI